MSDVVDLNVGGVGFSTTRTTLSLLEPGSFLARLALSGVDNGTGGSAGAGLSTRRDASGRIFIDRDGERFRIVLNYLRTGTVHASDKDTLGALRDEAEFYCLPKLSALCSAELSRLELESYLVSLSSGNAKNELEVPVPKSPTGVTTAGDSVFRLDAEF